MKNLGYIIVVLGLLMTIYTVLPFTTEKKIAEIGPVEINKKTDHALNWSPLLGICVVIIGAVLILKPSKN